MRNTKASYNLSKRLLTVIRLINNRNIELNMKKYTKHIILQHFPNQKLTNQVFKNKTINTIHLYQIFKTNTRANLTH